MHSLAPVEPSPEPVKEVSFWRSVLDALQGKSHDYTSEYLPRAVLLLAVPMVLEMAMESLFAVADVYWVSKLGSDAVAVIGITESLMTLVYAAAIGLGIAATAIVSRRIGEKDLARASEAAGQILLLSGVIAVAMGLALGYYSSEILQMMGAGDGIVKTGGAFTRIMLGGNVTVFLLFVGNAIFRGAGDAVIAMRTLCLANVLNIALGPLFIFGWGPVPAMGVTGAAIATNIGRGIGVLYLVWTLSRKGRHVRICWRHFIPDPALLGNVLKTAGPGMAQMLITTTSWVGLFKILSVFGSAALAGYTIAIRLVLFALLPASGLANAGATLVGQNLGAEKPGRAEAAIRIAVRYNTLCLGAVGLFFIVLAPYLVGGFTKDPDVAFYATRALQLLSLGFPFYAAGMCFEGSFNGAGDTGTPTRMNFCCLWLGQVPLAWLLSRHFGFGPNGIFFSVSISFTALAIWGGILFRRGKWKLKKV